jgi:hypothetical protein
MRGLKRAMKRPWVVMMMPTEEGAAPSPSLMGLRTGAMTLPAMMVSVAEARMTAREVRLDLISQISNLKEL